MKNLKQAHKGVFLLWIIAIAISQLTSSSSPLAQESSDMDFEAELTPDGRGVVIRECTGGVCREALVCQVAEECFRKNIVDACYNARGCHKKAKKYYQNQQPHLSVLDFEE